MDDQRFEGECRVDAEILHRVIPEMIRVSGVLQQLIGHARSVKNSKCLSLRSHEHKPS